MNGFRFKLSSRASRRSGQPPMDAKRAAVKARRRRQKLARRANRR